MYDAKIGRFLTTDPIVSRPLSGQSWNAYSYVLNNPLNYVDPSGFDYDAEIRTATPDWDPYKNSAAGQQILRDRGPDGRTVEGPKGAAQDGATTRPVDVSTTGSAAGHVPQSAAAVAAGPNARPVAVQIGAGILKGAFGFAASLAETTTAKGQLHVALTAAQNALAGARAGGALDGVAGWVNTFNPIYGIAVAGLETKAGIHTGNYEQAAGAATTGVLIFGAAIVGGRGGAAEPTLGQFPLTHFTDAAGLEGITGLDPAALTPGQVVAVDALRFGEGANPFLDRQPGGGSIFVTELEPTASPGQLIQIGVSEARQQFAIQFSRESAFANGGLRVDPSIPGRSIFTIPGGTTLTSSPGGAGPFHFLVHVRF
jgi:hypothetical protein